MRLRSTMRSDHSSSFTPDTTRSSSFTPGTTTCAPFVRARSHLALSLTPTQRVDGTESTRSWSMCRLLRLPKPNRHWPLPQPHPTSRDRSRGAEVLATLTDARENAFRVMCRSHVALVFGSTVAGWPVRRRARGAFAPSRPVAVRGDLFRGTFSHRRAESLLPVAFGVARA